MSRKEAIALLSIVTLLIIVINVIAIPKGWFVFLNGLILIGYAKLVTTLWKYIF